MANFNNNRTWGVEMEFLNTREVNIEKVITEINAKGIECHKEGYNHTDKNYWKMVTDASVGSEVSGENGHELVSPPLKGEEGFRQLRIVTDVLKENKVKINKTCGLHVHHDAHDLTVKNFKNLYTLYIRYENTLDSILPESRRGTNNQYCDTVRKTSRYNHNLITLESIAEVLEQIKKVKTIQDISNLYQGDRYHKINIESYTRHGTIEFRQHSGTIEYEKIANWIMLTNIMVERSFESVTAKYTGNDDTLTGLAAKIGLYSQYGANEMANEIRRFYQKRIKDLNKNPEETPVAA